MKNRKKIVIALLPISLLIIILLISSLDNSEDNNQLGVNSSFSYAPIAIPEDKDFTIRLSHLIVGFFNEYLKEQPYNWTQNIVDNYDTIINFK